MGIISGDDTDPDIPRDTSPAFNAFAGAVRRAWRARLREDGLPPSTPWGRHAVEVEVLFGDPPRVAVRPTPGVPGLAEVARAALYELGLDVEDALPHVSGRRVQIVTLVAARPLTCRPAPRQVRELWAARVARDRRLPLGLQPIALARTVRGIRVLSTAGTPPAVYAALVEELRNAGILDQEGPDPDDWELFDLEGRSPW